MKRLVERLDDLERDKAKSEKKEKEKDMRGGFAKISQKIALDRPEVARLLHHRICVWRN